MIKVLIGDMFDSSAQTLVNTVNCVGVMGKGVALEFKNRFPDMYKDYVKRCEARLVQLGEPYLFARLTPPSILNFPTKEHWRSASQLDAIIRGLQYLESHYQEWGITSLAVPPLGCGHGQLEWLVVGPTLYRYLKRLDLPIEIYAPFGTPHEELQPTFLDQVERPIYAPDRIGPAWAALVEILARLEREPYHPPVGRIAFQKLAYFATVSKIPTGLHFERGSYGPFSKELTRRKASLENNGLIREQPSGRMFVIKVGPTFEDARRAYGDQIGQWQAAIDTVADLFMRMDTKQAELAATVHFAAKSLQKQINERPTEGAVLSEVMQWKQRRRPPLGESEVALTIRYLNMLNWLDAEASDDLPIPEDERLDV